MGKVIKHGKMRPPKSSSEFRRKGKEKKKRKVDLQTDKSKTEKVNKKVKRVEVSYESEDYDSDEITIEEIKKLGGNKHDLKLLTKGKNEEKELDETGESELKHLIKSLELDKFTHEKMGMQEEATSENLLSNEVEDVIVKAENLSPHEGEKELKFNFLKTATNRSHCVVKLQDKWYTDLQGTKETDDVESNNSSTNMSYWIQKITKHAEKVFNLETQNYQNAMKNKANRNENSWFQAVISKGTLTDRLSAIAVQIQTSPVHNLQNMELLLSMVTLKSRRACLLAMDTLSQLLKSDLLIPDRKLRIFDKNPFNTLQQLSGGNKDTLDRYLILWMFEHKLKQFYSRFLQALAEVGKDTIENTKVKVMNTLQRLLLCNPENEHILLENIVNRLGDPSRAVAARAMHYLSGILDEFPSMKDVIVREVERILYRPNISARAQYYGICFLSQLTLDKEDDTNLAGNLIIIYFSFFKNTIKKGEIDSKLMSALLTGVHRAFPYCALQGEVLDVQIETIHKLVHIVNFNISVQALTLLFQILDSRNSITDRFYTSLYKKVVDPDFAVSSKQVMFLNLLFNAVLKDEMVTRVQSFIKRMLQTCEYLPSQCSAGVLYILSEILRKRTDLPTASTKLDSVDKDLSRFDYSDDDDDEYYQDADVQEQDPSDSSNVNGEKKLSKSTAAEERQQKIPGFVFRKKSTLRNETGYNFFARNPLYASGSESTALWELNQLCKHYHPTVALFARHLSERKDIKYPGDPLNDFTLTNFLDRFVFKNPKKNVDSSKHVSIHGKRKLYRPQDSKMLAPDSSEFINRAPESVPGDEVFIFKYFQAKADRKGDQDDDDNASINSEDIDAFLGGTGDVDFAGGMGTSDEIPEDNSDGEEWEDKDLSHSSDSDPELDETNDDGFKDLSSGNEESDNDGQLEDNDGEELDEETLEFSNDEDDDDDDDEPAMKKSKIQLNDKKFKMKKFDPSDLQSLLADADDFSHLLEENNDEGTLSSYSDADKASTKQLKWERQRENFMKNSQHWKRKTKMRGKFKGSKKFGNKKK